MTIENYESEEIISDSTTSETRENNPTKKNENENDSEYQNFDGNSNLSNDHDVKDVDTESMASDDEENSQANDSECEDTETLGTKQNSISVLENKYLPPGPSDISRTRDGMPTRPDLESYPMHKDGKFFRSFTKKFYKYEWLEYSVSKDAVFCYYCRHFLHDNADEPFNDAFRVNGFRHWKKCYGKDNKENRLLKHQLSSFHCTAVVNCNLFKESQNKGNILTQLSKEKATIVNENRHYMRTLCEILLLIAHQKIGIRESNEFRQSDVTIKKDVIDYGPHGGNFLSMLALVAKHDDIIARKIRNGPSNCKYTHHSIQKALLGIMAEEVQKEISNERKIIIKKMWDQATLVCQEMEVEEEEKRHKKLPSYLKNYLVESPAEKEEVNNYDVYCRTIITAIDKILAEIDRRFSNDNKSIILGLRALVPGSPNFLEEEDILTFAQLYGANIDDLSIELKNMEKVMKRKNSNKPAIFRLTALTKLVPQSLNARNASLLRSLTSSKRTAFVMKQTKMETYIFTGLTPLPRRGVIRNGSQKSVPTFRNALSGMTRDRQVDHYLPQEFCTKPRTDDTVSHNFSYG
ncbi:hypothetical protein HNY73_017403 [Argiope bruennichi]|uniref:TTF-type domain-containing protein n=1 Tax=Argiope bruennichi TaxID=94029 RepID=A0A8T0EDJ8_ARGBR|nr:hypothetical protein HNY73_017403 [Argiope bruennichi]